jgi:hypothetical protein
MTKLIFVYTFCRLLSLHLPNDFNLTPMLSLIKSPTANIFLELESFIAAENERLLFAQSDLEKILIKHRIADAKLVLTGLRLAQSGA